MNFSAGTTEESRRMNSSIVKLLDLRKGGEVGFR